MKDQISTLESQLKEKEQAQNTTQTNFRPYVPPATKSFSQERAKRERMNATPQKKVDKSRDRLYKNISPVRQSKDDVNALKTSKMKSEVRNTDIDESLGNKIET
jgi:hypothetical protein